MRWSTKAMAVVVTAVLAACGGGTSSVDAAEATSANEDFASSADALTGSHPAGSTLRTTAALNLRTGPSTSHGVIRVIPKGDTVVTVDSQVSNGWYHIRYSGSTGWSSGSYLTLVSNGSSGGGSSGGGSSPPTARQAALNRAKTGVGFSYWWGHGKWEPGQLSNSTRGSCSGSCPSCSHSGRNGADCSGYVGKVWQVGTNGSTPTIDGHPYSTYNFKYENHGWSQVARGSIIAGDALVHHDSGSGHVFIYDGGDRWGSLWAYEAKGCAYGIIHDLRTAGSTYVGIRRSGY